MYNIFSLYTQKRLFSITLFIILLKNSNNCYNYYFFSLFQIPTKHHYDSFNKSLVFYLKKKPTMESLFTQNVSDEPDDIPQTQEPVWILGKKYNAIKGLKTNKNQIQ